MNQKNSLGLNKSFKDEDNPISLFKIWFEDIYNKPLDLIAEERIFNKLQL